MKKENRVFFLCDGLRECRSSPYCCYNGGICWYTQDRDNSKNYKRQSSFTMDDYADPIKFHMHEVTDVVDGKYLTTAVHYYEFGHLEDWMMKEE